VESGSQNRRRVSSRTVRKTVPASLIELAEELSAQLAGCRFGPPVDRVYRPLEYAWEAHREYLRRFGNGQRRVLMLGMNPGPWGMAQTGVPFGEVPAVRDWMGIEAPVGKPADELWGLFAERFGTADAFFQGHFVANYCPLVWMRDTGANLTPDKLPAGEMAAVEEACRCHLTGVIELLQPEFLVGIGAYAEGKLKVAAEELGCDAALGRVLHPSPASPAANRGWAEAATKQFEAMGVW